MGLSGQIQCPTCDRTLSQRLGMGEEGLWGSYVEYAQREMATECPNHSDGAWQFLKTPEWKAVERAYYSSYT